MSNQTDSAATMRKLAVWMTVSTAILIAWATLAPSASLPTPPGNDKVHHLIGFAALTFPAGLLYQRSLIWVLPFAILFGGMIEIIQPFVGRHREVADFVAGTAGALVGAGIGWTFRAPMLLAVSRVERFRGP